MGTKKGGLDMSHWASKETDATKESGGGTYDPEVLEKKEFDAKHSDTAEFAKIFVMPLDMEKSLKHPTVLYGDNNERMEVLKSVLNNVNKTDALNYIVKAYFEEHGLEIKKAWDKQQKNKRSLF